MASSRLPSRPPRRKSGFHTCVLSFLLSVPPLACLLRRPLIVFFLLLTVSASWSLVNQFGPIPGIIIDPPRIRQRPVNRPEIFPTALEPPATSRVGTSCPPCRTRAAIRFSA